MLRELLDSGNVLSGLPTVQTIQQHVTLYLSNLQGGYVLYTWAQQLAYVDRSHVRKGMGEALLVDAILVH